MRQLALMQRWVAKVIKEVKGIQVNSRKEGDKVGKHNNKRADTSSSLQQDPVRRVSLTIVNSLTHAAFHTTKQQWSLRHPPWAHSLFNQIHFNFHRSSNSSSHCARPPTHQSWGGHAAACSSQLCVEKCGNPDLRPEALRETHVPLPILGSNQGGNGSSLRDRVYTRERKKHAYTHIHTHTHGHICLFGRQGTQRFSRLQQMATMPRAKSKSGQQTDNCCQSREGWEAKYQISFIYVYWQNTRQNCTCFTLSFGDKLPQPIGSHRNDHLSFIIINHKKLLKH